MSELKLEDVVEKLRELLSSVDHEQTTTKDVFRLLADELGDGIKVFKTEIRAAIEKFFEELGTEKKRVYCLELCPSVNLHVIEDAEGRHVEMHCQGTKGLVLSEDEFCAFADNIETVKRAVADENKDFHVELSADRNVTLAEIKTFKIELSHSAKKKTEKISIQMDPCALDTLGEHKQSVLDKLHANDKEQPTNTSKKRCSSAEQGPSIPNKSQKTVSGHLFPKELGNNIFLTVSEFKGRMRADLRKYYTDKNSGELRPTQKGLSMDKDQFTILVQNLEDIKGAVREQMSDYLLEIGHNRRATVSDFTGKFLVDLREYYQPKTGGPLKPTKKGISFDVSLLDVLSTHAQDILAKLD